MDREQVSRRAHPWSWCKEREQVLIYNLNLLPSLERVAPHLYQLYPSEGMMRWAQSAVVLVLEGYFLKFLVALIP